MSDEIGSLDKLDLSILDDLEIPKIDSKGGEKKDLVEEAPEDVIVTDTDTPEEIENEEIEEEEPIIAGNTEELEPPVPEETEESTESEEGLIKVVSEWAAQVGVIDLDEGEEIGDEEDFLINKLNKKVEKEVEAYKESIPEDVKYLIDNWEKGVDMSRFLQSEARESDLNSITNEDLEDNEALSKDIVSAYLRSQEYDEEEIADKLEMYADKEILIREAVTARKKLVRMEEKYQTQMEAQAKKEHTARLEDNQKRLDTYKETVMGIEEIFPGVKVTKEERKRIIDLTTKPVAKDGHGNPMTALGKIQSEDPNFVTKLAYIAGVLKWDLSKIDKAATTKATRGLKKKVATYGSNKPSLSGKIDLKAVKGALSKYKQQSNI